MLSNILKGNCKNVKSITLAFYFIKERKKKRKNERKKERKKKKQTNKDGT